MSSRRSSIVDRLALVVLWLGMVGFVAFHSLVISPSRGDPAVTSFRIAWFAGLGFVTALVVYFGVRADSNAEGT